MAKMCKLKITLRVCIRRVHFRTYDDVPHGMTREIKHGNDFESIPNLWCDPQNINRTYTILKKL